MCKELEEMFKSADLDKRREYYINNRNMLIDKFISNQKTYFHNSNKTVLQFIANFLYHGVPEISLEDSAESIRSTFRAGYCYYFANMLLLAFNRGCVCWTAPFSHIVWVDVDGYAYDIEGVYSGEAEHLIPIEYIEDSLWSFKHVPGVNGIIRDCDSIIEVFTKDVECGVIKEKGLDYILKGY